MPYATQNCNYVWVTYTFNKIKTELNLEPEKARADGNN